MPLEGSSERVGMVTTDRAFQILAEADSPGVVRARASGRSFLGAHACVLRACVAQQRVCQSFSLCTS